MIDGASNAGWHELGNQQRVCKAKSAFLKGWVCNFCSFFRCLPHSLRTEHLSDRDPALLPRTILRPIREQESRCGLEHLPSLPRSVWNSLAPFAGRSSFLSPMPRCPLNQTTRQSFRRIRKFWIDMLIARYVKIEYYFDWEFVVLCNVQICVAKFFSSQFFVFLKCQRQFSKGRIWYPGQKFEQNPFLSEQFIERLSGISMRSDSRKKCMRKMYISCEECN